MMNSKYIIVIYLFMQYIKNNSIKVYFDIAEGNLNDLFLFQVYYINVCHFTAVYIN